MIEKNKIYLAIFSVLLIVGIIGFMIIENFSLAVLINPFDSKSHAVVKNS